MGAFSTVPSTLRCAAATLACAWSSWFCALAIASALPPASARSRASRAEVRLRLAAARSAWTSVASTEASVCPNATRSPTFTLMSVTWPGVAKSAVIEVADSTEPSALTVAVTVPCATATVRKVVAVAGFPLVSST
jgi:hypothetical protein